MPLSYHICLTVVLLGHVIVIKIHISLSSFKTEHCEILLVVHFAHTRPLFKQLGLLMLTLLFPPTQLWLKHFSIFSPSRRSSTPLPGWLLIFLLSTHSSKTEFLLIGLKNQLIDLYLHDSGSLEQTFQIAIVESMSNVKWTFIERIYEVSNTLE